VTLAFSNDGKLLYSGGMDKQIRVWDVAASKQVKQLTGHPDFVLALALHPDGNRLVSAGYGGNVMVWDLASGKVLLTKKPAMGAYSVAITPDKKAILSGHENGVCYLTAMPPA
jgi:WD40 repeat protein